MDERLKMRRTTDSNHALKVRRTDPLEASMSIIENNLANTDEKVDKIAVLLTNTIDRLDTHIEHDNMTHTALLEGLSKNTVAISSLTSTMESVSTNIHEMNQTLKTTTTIANFANEKVTKYDVINMTLTKIIAAIVIVSSAVWSIYEFNQEHPNTLPVIGNTTNE